MLKIGLVQLSVAEGEVEKNCSHIIELTKRYASRGIDLLCFPELSISGYDFERAGKSKEEKEFFSELAKENHLAIMAGVNGIHAGKHYDEACMWNEEGRILGEYKKIHLWDKESGFFEAGDELFVIPFKGWKIGLLLCADMRFFEVSAFLKNMGADLIIYPSAWAKGWEELFHLCGRMRAAENQIYTVTLNRASGDVKYCGGTAVMGPDGSILSCLSDDEEGYLEAWLHKAQIQKARESLDWDGQKRPDVYRRYEQYRFAKKEI